MVTYYQGSARKNRTSFQNAKVDILCSGICLNVPEPLRQVLPLSQAPRPAHVHLTCRSLSRLDMHPYQLETGLTIHYRESCRRSFPSCAGPVWNALPSAVLNHPPDRKRMQTLKVALFGISVLSVGTRPRAPCNLALDTTSYIYRYCSYVSSPSVCWIVSLLSLLSLSLSLCRFLSFLSLSLSLCVSFSLPPILPPFLPPSLPPSLSIFLSLSD